MLLVIFGAGASYDSIPFLAGQNRPDRPPLANELFDPRPPMMRAWDHYPIVTPVVPRLQHLASGDSLESRLSDLAAEAPDYSRRYNLLAAMRYYLQEVIGDFDQEWYTQSKGVTNYAALIDRIERHKKTTGEAVYVTFNYDTLLERAFGTFGRGIGAVQQYIDGQRPLLIKPHGSVTWGRVIDWHGNDLLDMGAPLNLAGSVVEKFQKLRVLNDFVWVNRRPPELMQQRFAVLPAIGVPLDSKTDFAECPVAHIQALQSALPKVTKLITVGWRANEKHFLELWHRHAGAEMRGLCVAKNLEEAAETAQRLSGAGLPGEFDAVDGGFTDFCKSATLDTFLES